MQFIIVIMFVGLAVLAGYLIYGLVRDIRKKIHEVKREEDNRDKK